MAEPFVILYELQVYNGPAQWHVRLWHRAVEGTALNPLPANPHFIAQFKAAVWKPQYLWTPELDTPAVVPSFATNQHFIARYTPLQFVQRTFPPPTDAPIPAADVPTYFIAPYKTTTLYFDRTLFQKPTEDQSTPTPTFATNQHFTARYTPPQLYRPTFPQPTDAPVAVADVPTYFTARFVPASWRAQFLWLREIDTPAATPTFETNTSTIASFKQPSLYRPTFPQPTDGAAVVVPDAPLHFVARFQSVWWKPQYLWARAVDEGTVGLSADVPTYFTASFTPTVWKPQSFFSSVDVQVSIADNPTYFTARYTPYLWKAQFLWATADIPIFEANAHCVAIYQERLRFAIRMFLPSFDGSAPDNPTYFTARFAPYSWKAQYLWVNALDAPTVETNVHFVARYSPSALWFDRTLFQRPTEDQSTPAATFATNINFTASFTPLSFKLDSSLHLVPATDFVQQAAPLPATQYPTPFGAFITFGKMG